MSNNQTLNQQFPYLIANPNGDKTITKQNLIKYLKNFFPGIKFSVKKENYSTYCITWENGPTIDQVNEITFRFQDHGSDETGDFWDYKPTDFNKMFGGFKHIFKVRNQGADVKAVLPELRHLLSCKDDYHAENILHRIFSQQSLPADAIVTGLSARDVRMGNEEYFYQLNFIKK